MSQNQHCKDVKEAVKRFFPGVKKEKETPL